MGQVVPDNWWEGSTTPSQKECRPGSVFVRQTRFSSDTLSETENVDIMELYSEN
jgi:hypothetical protein